MTHSITIELDDAAWAELKAAADAGGVTPDELAAARLSEAALLQEDDLDIDEAKLGPLLDEAEEDERAGRYADKGEITALFARHGRQWPPRWRSSCSRSTPSPGASRNDAARV